MGGHEKAAIGFRSVKPNKRTPIGNLFDYGILCLAYVGLFVKIALVINLFI